MPNQYNDMHSLRNGSTDLIAQGDNWLAANVPIIMASPEYKHNGVIMVVWDETEGGDTSQYTIPFFLISPLAKAGYSNSALYTHSSVLKTLEEIEGVGNLGGAGGASVAAANDLSNLFVPGVLTPSTLEGTVFKNAGHDDKGVAGETVLLTGTNDANQFVRLTTKTGADGSYAFTGLLPGTYNVTVDDVKGARNIKLGVDQTLTGVDLFLHGHHGNKHDDGDGDGGFDF